MKKLPLIFFSFIFFIVHSAFSQAPLVKMWDQQHGGTDRDWLNCFQHTRDGGFILGGYSHSGISGDKTQDTIGNFDYWVVKTDSLGNKQWDKDFGGTGYDELNALVQTSDGGYLLGGASFSGAGGDKTQPSQGLYDYWIVKIDSLGNKLWDKDFGGSNHDGLYSLDQTTDGGYILGGYSLSGISGDKSQPLWSFYADFWVIKIDSLGNKEWDKDFGGTWTDELHSVSQTTDGGYILGGYSMSVISGNKSQASFGLQDYWVVKIDSLGVKQWDKDFGGTLQDRLTSLQQTADGGYILGGWSISGVGGNKTGALQGGSDFWVVKIDSLGIKQWDRDYGGNSDDELYSIYQTADRGYLLAGVSQSDSSGDKTENNLGYTQTWAIKTDSSGSKQWDKTVLTLGQNENGYGVQIEDGCFVFANWDNGGIGGEKSQATWGDTDYWIIKFCDSVIVMPVAAVFSVSDICPGTCTGFTNLSQNATSYQWYFPGASPDTSTAVNPIGICYPTPGSYDVTLIAGSASGSDTLVLSNFISVFPYSPTQSIIQSGDSLISNSGFITYQWFYFGDTIPGATTSFYLATQSGDYSVVCLDSNGCSVEAVLQNVVTGLEPAMGSLQLVTLFPNPANTFIKLEDHRMHKQPLTYSIWNSWGERGSVESFYGDRIDISGLSKGVYWMEISDSKNIRRVRFIRQ